MLKSNKLKVAQAVKKNEVLRTLYLYFKQDYE